MATLVGAGSANHLATANTTTSVLTLPGSAVAGDIIILASASNGSTHTAAISGRTPLLGPTTVSTVLAAYLWGYALSAGDITAGTITVTWNTTGRNTAAFEVWSGLDATTPIESGPGSVAVAANNVTPGAEATTVDNSPVVLCVVQKIGTSTPLVDLVAPSGFTVDAQARFTAANGNSGTGVMSLIQGTAGTVTPGNVTAGGVPAQMIAYTVALRNAADGGPAFIARQSLVLSQSIRRAANW